MVKKHMGLYSPVERKSKPKYSIKTGETKQLTFYAKGNRSYFVFKKRVAIKKYKQRKKKERMEFKKEYKRYKRRKK